jgi:membrane protein DedA with SNARE-associated domain
MTPHLPELAALTGNAGGGFAQGAVLAVATFVQEDIPTITAALLAGAGRVTWMTAYLGCFLGIWIGDALLYLAARCFGRPVLAKPWFQRLADPSSVAESERWFARRGTWLLITSRFVPGTRLPTYLAAGFLRHPFGRFLAVTGVTVAVWTALLLFLAHALGGRLKTWMEHTRWPAWLAPVLVVLLLTVWRFPFRKVRRRISTILGRWTRWEFWPAWLFYIPVGFQYVRLALRHGGLTVPASANPGMTNGGLVGESKFETLEELFRSSPEFTAEAWLLKAGKSGDREAELSRLVVREGLKYPFIMKPDVGQRGAGVKLIRDASAAGDYLRGCDVPLVVQRYVPGPCEAGVFYYRLPGERHGHVFAITEKIFPHVTGDGKRTVEMLIASDPRARFMENRYLARFANRRAEILAPGETLRLVEAGNHAQGCIFQDGIRLRTPELERRIDDISQKLNGFFIGRYDIRYEAEHDLRSGRSFQILELNGAAAEATAIYDARNSLRAAYATLFRQWELVFAIGATNRRCGSRRVRALELIQAWRACNRSLATCPDAD